jgi:CDP-glycerol glycerophosphotransferase (TagB/SpsB family)
MKSPRVNDYQLVWLVKNKILAEERLRQDYPDFSSDRVKVVQKNTLRGLFCFLRSRYVFFTHGVYWFAHAGFHQTVVNLWHGMPIKKIGVQLEERASVELPFAHYSIATSDFFADVIADSLRVPREHVLVTGLPRNEWILTPTPEHVAVKEGRSRMVVWLPTYRQLEVDGYVIENSTDVPDPLSASSLADLDRKLQGIDLLLVLKLHPGDIRNRDSWPGYKNIRVLRDADFRAEGLNVYKLLACADALITDFSSVAIDYLTVNKPIGVFAPDRSTYTRGFVNGAFEKLDTVCHSLNSVDDVAAFVRDLPAARPQTAELNELYRQDLHSPSRDILHAIGLAPLCSVNASFGADRKKQ